MSVSSQGSRKASLSPTSPTIKVHQASASTESAPGISRTNLKVSFKDRIRNIQKDEKADGNVESFEAKQQLLPSTSAIKPKKTSTTKQLKDKIKSFGHLPKDELTPWSKLKRATVVGLGGSYTSLSNNLTEDSPKLSKTLIKSSMPVNLNIVSNKLDAHIFQPFSTSRSHPLNDEQKTSCSDSDSKKYKPQPYKLKDSEPKSYRSVDDLSPEYSGLPFVKKLKILNERQKLAELESAIQTTRSLSLDYTDSSNSSDVIEVLTRSQSEASCMIRGASLVPVAPPNFMSLIPMNAKSPLSPESNETIERKNLKSILRKKLSEDRLQNVTSNKQSDRQDMKRLMRAQTLEGYVARRTKFMKSVTFNHTLSSPPSTTLTEEPEESLKDSPNDISPQFPPVFSPTAPNTPALYPIANAQEDPNNQVNGTTCTNRINYSAEATITVEEPPRILTPPPQPQHAQLLQPSLNNTSNSEINTSGTLAFVSDNYAERKLIKGI